MAVAQYQEKVDIYAFALIMQQDWIQKVFLPCVFDFGQEPGSKQSRTEAVDIDGHPEMTGHASLTSESLQPLLLRMQSFVPRSS